MKSAKMIFLIIIAAMFLGGCSNVNSDNSISKEEMQIQTMTKVQSDVNEIMNRDIDYVLENMGTPYSVTYSVSIDDYDSMEDLKNIRDVEDIEIVSKGFLYPKYISDDQLDGSAIYIIFKDGIVSKVETCDFKNLDISQLKDDEADAIISMNTEYENIDLTNLDEQKLQMYVGQEQTEVIEMFENEKCKYSVFSDVDGEIDVRVYSINENEVFIIFIKDGNIKFIDRQNTSDILSILDIK